MFPKIIIAILIAGYLSIGYVGALEIMKDPDDSLKNLEVMNIV